MSSADNFSSDYQEARAKFRQAVAEGGGALESAEYPERGPDGASLFTDIAWFGSRSAEKVLVMISGTHGVEGFCGSGAQVDWLRRGEQARVPSDIAVLMIHAINPHGFAWLRRVTHENVDLNRNWADFNAPLPENPGYEELSAAICPSDWSEESLQKADEIIADYVERNGSPAFYQAISGGQYRHPTGVFYGGRGPTWSRRTQESIYGEYLGSAGAICMLDYHTGLGPPGFCEELTPEAPSSDAFLRALEWFGAVVVSTIDGSSSSSNVVGSGLGAARVLLPNATVTTLALEFGTQPRQDVQMALRADAWLHAHGDLQSPLGKSLKTKIRDAFYGDTADWKGMVAGQSLLICRQALAGLAQG